MKALILAAGYATRLYPLTLDKPKPLLPIAGKPIIEYIIEKIEAIEGIDEIFIVTNQKFHRTFEVWAKESSFSKKLTVVNDETLEDATKLGAIGDMDFVIKRCKVDEDLLVVAGDNLFDFDLAKFSEFALSKDNKAVVGLLRFKDRSLLSKYGIVDLGQDKSIVDFQEKPEEPKSNLVALGLYYFPKEKVRMIGEYIESGEKPDAPGHYIDWLRNRETVYGYVFDQVWFDIGDKESLQRADDEYKKRKQ